MLGHELCGCVPSGSPDVVIVANNLGYRPLPSNDNEEALFPRLGSFEVSVTLYDTRTGQRWGPNTLYSKLSSYKVGRAMFPPRSLLRSRPRHA